MYPNANVRTKSKRAIPLPMEFRDGGCSVSLYFRNWDKLSMIYYQSRY